VPYVCRQEVFWGSLVMGCLALGLFRVLARVCAYDFCFVLNYIGRPEGDRGFP